MSLFRAALSTRPQGTRRARLRRAARLRRSASAATAAGVAGAVLAVDVAMGAGAANAATMDEFRRLAQCESGGDYSINTGNGYYGAYQFSLGTWRSLGYGGYPHQASPGVQDEAAVRLQTRSGWGQWPACSRKLNLVSSRGLVAAPPPAPLSEIDRHYAAHAGLRNGLGAVTSPEFAVAGGRVRLYQRGQIVSSPATGAKAVWGAIFTEYGAHRWEQGPLGFPTSDEHPIPGGRASHFQRGAIVFSPATGARVLKGEIGKAYTRMGSVTSPLGFPTTGERPEDGGVSQAFADGEIFWDATTGATTPLRGEVLRTYRAAGGPAGALGMPRGATPGGAQFEGGSILVDGATRTATVVTD